MCALTHTVSLRHTGCLLSQSVMTASLPSRNGTTYPGMVPTKQSSRFWNQSSSGPSSTAPLHRAPEVSNCCVQAGYELFDLPQEFIDLTFGVVTIATSIVATLLGGLFIDMVGSSVKNAMAFCGWTALVSHLLSICCSLFYGEGACRPAACPKEDLSIVLDAMTSTICVSADAPASI